MRDLGASLNTTFVNNTSLSRQRLQDAAQVLLRIAHLPFSMAHKIRFAMSCAHSRGLYGCEAAPVDESALGHHASILLQVVGTHNTMHARSLILSFCGGPPTLDPYVEIFTKRILMLRRVWIKLPALRPKIVQLYQHYQSSNAPGTDHPHVDVDCLTPAPLPGGERRGEWRWATLPQGPVAIVLDNVHWMAATLDIPSFTLSAKFDHNIHILSDP